MSPAQSQSTSADWSLVAWAFVADDGMTLFDNRNPTDPLHPGVAWQFSFGYTTCNLNVSIAVGNFSTTFHTQAQVPLEQWVCLAAVYHAVDNRFEFFINGTSVGNNTEGHDHLPSGGKPGRAMIGLPAIVNPAVVHDDTEWRTGFSGYLRLLNAYNTALTTSQLAELMSFQHVLAVPAFSFNTSNLTSVEVPVDCMDRAAIVNATLLQTCGTGSFSLETDSFNVSRGDTLYLNVTALSTSPSAAGELVLLTVRDANAAF
jgi:hypothetical protein